MRPLQYHPILDFFAFVSSSKKASACCLQKKMQAISDELDRYPQILKLVAKDFESLSKAKTKRGRGAVFSAETLFRGVFLVLMFRNDYRRARDEIMTNAVYFNFCRLPGNKETISSSLLCKALRAIQPETMYLIHEILAKCNIADGTIKEPDIQRTDTTAVETNIHYPTDTSLLWDIYRSLYNHVKFLRCHAQGVFKERFHPQKIKRCHLLVTRNLNSKSKKRIRSAKTTLRMLLKMVESTLTKIQAACSGLKLPPTDTAAQNRLDWLRSHFPVMRQIINVARRRLNGENVPNSDKVYSLFEPHTELIIRGRAEKPLEWGHKVLLTQTKDRFIIDCMVLEENTADSNLTETVIERYKEIYGRRVTHLTADKGFCPDKDTYEELEEVVDLQIPKRLRDLASPMMKEAQRFRAGIEGCISTLKRVFRMSKCRFRGFKTFETFVLGVVFCHNIQWCAMRR